MRTLSGVKPVVPSTHGAAGLQEPDSGWETFIPGSRANHFGNHAAKGTPNRPETVPGIPG